MQKKFMILPIFLVLALAMTGVAYGHWSKVITVSGTVESGTLNLIIVAGSPSDGDTGIDPGYDKDIADTTIVIDPDDNQKAIITITNAYPSYSVIWHLTIRNVGTIPAKLQAIIVTAPDCIDATAWDGLGVQLDPESWGGEPTYYQEDVSGEIHVLQNAEQDTPYTFTVEFVYVNWNEYVPP